MAIVSLWTPLAFERIAERWFSLPNFFFLWPVPLLTALVAFAGVALARERTRRCLPFLAAIALFLLGYLGLVISNFPYLVPPIADDLGDGGGAREPDLHADRHADHAADHPRLHGLRVLDCSAARCARARAITKTLRTQLCGDPLSRDPIVIM